MEVSAPDGIDEKRNRMSRSIIAFLGALFVIVAVVSSFVVLRMTRGGDGGGSLDPLIQELTSTSPIGLPSYALVEKRTQAGYVVALEIPRVLEKMPCYCSCVNMDHGDGNVLKHSNNRDCFIKSDGSFEEHAAYCDLCQYIALDAYDMYSRGMPLSDIRSAIDSRYGNDRYGPGTNTPPVV